MTVGELIERLKACNPERQVRVMTTERKDGEDATIYALDEREEYDGEYILLLGW